MPKSENIQVDVSQMDTFLGRAPNFYKIRAEDRSIISFDPNHPQQQLHQIVEEEKRRTKELYGYEQVKITVLKGRQLGISTYYAIYQMDAMNRLSNYELQVLAHDSITTQKLYDIYKRAYKNMPNVVDLVDPGGNVVQENYPIKPETESLSGRQMKFAELQSQLSVRTAGGGDNVGKGGNLSALHASEFANYEHAKDVLSSISQALPRKGDIFSMIESTANGVSGIGEEFYKQWERSTEEWDRYQRGDTNHFDGYRPVFLAWYEHPKYSLPLRDGKMTDLNSIDFGPEGRKKYEEKEEFMLGELGLTLEQVNWYRWCIKNKCSYDLMDAYRYYPTKPKDAFMASDSCFFDSNKLFYVKKEIKNKGEREFVRGRVNEDLEFEEDSSGELKIYEMPDPQYESRYALGIDPSKNVEGGDYACIDVFDRLEEDFVAKWYGRMEEDQLALTAMRIAYFYNGALITPEANLSTLVNIIKPDGLVPYKGDIYYTASANKVSFGYDLKENSRKVLLDHYKIWLRDNYDSLNDLSELNEHVNFVKKNKHGKIKPEHADGENDDQIFGRSFAVFGSDWWDEEIAKITDDGNDYEKFFTVQPSVRKGYRQSELGRKKRKKEKTFTFPNSKRKKPSHTNLGRR